MNLVTLIHEEQLTLASGKLVYSAEETGALISAVNTAESLAKAHASASERIDNAVEEGRKQGYSEGHEAGLQEGREQVSQQLASLSAQHQQELEQLREQSTQMALQIVRKVAAQIAPDEKLSALASVAARECGPDEAISLHIHPNHCGDVQSRLESAAEHDTALRLVSLVPDDTLDEDGCVLETRYGSVVADLETQLRVIQQNLNGFGNG